MQECNLKFKIDGDRQIPAQKELIQDAVMHQHYMEIFYSGSCGSTNRQIAATASWNKKIGSTLLVINLFSPKIKANNTGYHDA